MRNFIIAVILTIATYNSVYAVNMVDLDTLIDRDGNAYYVNNNGYLTPYMPIKRNILREKPKPSKYRDWTYIDENGYDYTVVIEVKQ